MHEISALQKRHDQFDTKFHYGSLRPNVTLYFVFIKMQSNYYFTEVVKYVMCPKKAED